jgi:uncharacterized protein (DUF305 family)
MNEYRLTRKQSGWNRPVRIAALLLPAAVLLAVACGARAKPAVPYDLRFIDAMVAHHQGAVDMAMLADSNALHPELKEFARRIVADQTEEIGLMKQWRDQWFPDSPQVPNAMSMPGMAASMKGVSADRLRALHGADFDWAFVEMMVAHHEGGITMAKDALAKAEHLEIKQLAQKVIDIQGPEIEMMHRWKPDWTGGK